MKKSRGNVRNVDIISFTFSDKCGKIILAISCCVFVSMAVMIEQTGQAV